MKNFSAKTADFDSISISGEAPIVQSDLGTAPNQIPLNKDLGTLAYMDSSGVEDVNADTIELREIAAELSETAVDVFVYDTRKDSDGGAWRSRTSHTSWYNEELNTATRGSRREFPAVAVIVAEADKVTIYDGDDPDLSMWMVFNASSGKMIWAVQLGCVSSLNARMSIASPNGSGIRYIDFISDKMREWRTSGVKSVSGDISKRNSGDLARIDIPGQDVIVNQYINDVAMTVLPNAPIDADTGLPVPTIAVATDGGVSVIKDDGSVVDITSSQAINALMIYDNENKLLLRENGSACSYGPLNISSDLDIWTEWREGYFNNSNTMPATLPQINIGLHSDSKNELGVPSSEGLTLIDVDKSNPSISNGCYISSSYNTGWMPGDIKLATLSDTKVEKVGVDKSTELVTNGEFDSNIDGWTAFEHAGSTPTIEHDSSNGGRLKVTMTGSYTGATQTINNIKSGRYVVSANFVAGTHSNFYIQIAITGEETYLTNAVDLTNTNPQLEFDVPAGTTSIDVRVRGAVGSGIFYADNISVKQTGELITNGTFDNGIEGWIPDRGTISENNSVLQLSQTTGDNAYAYQDIDGFIVGKKYVISFELRGVDTSANMFGMVKDLVSNTELISREYVSSGFNGPFVKKSHSFVASSGSLRVFFMINTSTDNLSLEVDNISVRLAEDDRSVNDNGLQIFGEIDKTPVAPGADLVAYSGFSANNYLMQPYNPDLDFGTGDFCVMGWFKYTDHTSQIIINTVGAGQTGIQVGTGSSGLLGVSNYINGISSVGRVQTGFTKTYSINTWHMFTIFRSNGVSYFYVDGILDDSKVNNNNATSTSGIFVGYRPSDGLNGDATSLALLRISKTAPTPEQIAKIYRDEKPLFQDGAQATLYGTSDAVTALAYDDSENLLHVGTASGRSSFNGLKRVENTDVAVTTAISATEGLVIEQ